MKRIFFVCAFACAALGARIALADVIPPNTHPLEQCFKVVSLNTFPNVVLFQKVSGPTVHADDELAALTPLVEGQCLSKGYKFNTLDIYWANKGDVLSADGSHLLLGDAPVFGGYVPDDDIRVKVTLEYSIAGMKNGAPVLYKSAEITSTKGIVPPKTVTYPNPIEATPAPTPAPVPTPTPNPRSGGPVVHPPVPLPPTPVPVTTTVPARGLWGTLVCFFEGLFGDPCPA